MNKLEALSLLEEWLEHRISRAEYDAKILAHEEKYACAAQQADFRAAFQLVLKRVQGLKNDSQRAN